MKNIHNMGWSVGYDAASIGNQGTNIAAQENMWNFPQIPVGGFYAFQKDVASPAPKWFVRNVPFSLPYKPTFQMMNPSGFVTYSIGNPTNDCEVPCPGCPNQRMAEIATADGEFANLTPDELYAAQLGIFQILRIDSTWMYAGYASDAILQNFYDSASQTNMGMLNTVNDLIIDSLNFFASSVNSWISPVNHFEENAQIVNEIYLSTWAEGIFEFDSIQEYTLNNIANENPISGGDAVYIARVMLGLFVDDFLPNSNRQWGKNDFNFENTNDVQIYPNPANNKIYIKINSEQSADFSVHLYSTLGLQLFSYQLLINQNEIDVANIPNGIYLLKFFRNENCIETKKIIINR